MHKEFVDVIVKYTKQGKILPMIIIWNDGKRYQVDKILDITSAPSLKVGGHGTRYKCRILGIDTYLWLENECWFVEAKDC